MEFLDNVPIDIQTEVAGIAYLHHLKAIRLTAPIATCDGIGLFANGEAHCVRSEPGPIKGFKDCPACPEMVIVPAGSFTMGSPADEPGRESGEDQVRVTIARPFAVGRFAVTNVEWEACLDGGRLPRPQPPRSSWLGTRQAACDRELACRQGLCQLAVQDDGQTLSLAVGS
jgi:formylglycine-generating enzyme required for sulfatase activity